MKLPVFSEELVFKFVIKGNHKTETEYLPETADWFRNHKIQPRIGETVIPIESGPVKKPFYLVSSIVWDTHKNEVIFVLEKDVAKPV